MSVNTVQELTSGVYTVTLQDPDGTALLSADITSITMTLTEYYSGTAINGRSAQDVLDTNNCTMHATSGLFTWNVQSDDLVPVSAAEDEHELVRMLLVVVYAAGQLVHEKFFLLKNVKGV